MKKTLLPTLVAFGLMLQAACEKKEAPTPLAAPVHASETLRVVYIPKNTGNPYFNGIVEGIRKACEEHGAEFTTTAPANPDATAQIPFIKDHVQRGVDVICISPNSTDALNHVFDEARAKGVKVVTVDSDLTGFESRRDAGVLPADFNTLGQWQVEFLGSLINYEGKFAILSATTDAPNQNRWIHDIKQVLQQTKYARMELVEVVYGDDKPQKSRTEAEGLLTKHPDLRAILAPTTVGVEQAAKTVEAAGVYPGGPNAQGPGVVATGFGTPNQMRRYIKDGIVPAIALWVPADVGYVTGVLGIGLSKGTIQARPGQTFEVPNLGTMQIRDLNIVIAGPPIVFTRDNVDNYQF